MMYGAFWICHLNAMVPSVLSVASTVISTDGRPNILVSVILPVAELSAAASENYLSLDQYKERVAREILAAGYVGSERSPRRMALDLISQKKYFNLDKIAIEHKYQDRIKALENQLRWAEDALLADKATDMPTVSKKIKKEQD